MGTSRESKGRSAVSILKVIVVPLAVSMMLTGCASPSAKPPQLRLTNQGSTALKNLIVLFPEDQVAFGDVPAGATTGYKSVPHGVFRYAAYSLVINGKKIVVPVTDWVSEKPVKGNAFTYSIKFVRKRGNDIELVKVTKDQ